ncbi:MAG TPA: hypothetical protein VM680_18445 [Verrucomicrobiae bacterium]|nr:hypothetical protein [Verrucomicrobiae bacterium]
MNNSVLKRQCGSHPQSSKLALTPREKEAVVAVVRAGLRVAAADARKAIRKLELSHLISTGPVIVL